MRVFKPTEYTPLQLMKAGDICYYCGLPFKFYDPIYWLKNDNKYYGAHQRCHGVQHSTSR